MDRMRAHGQLTWNKQTQRWHLKLTDDTGGDVEVDTTDRQVLLDLVYAIQHGRHPVTTETVTSVLMKLTNGIAKVAQVDIPKDEHVVKAVVPRIGDAERTRACDLLARHFTEGRLTQEEFDERSTKAVAARTQPELDALFVDMPRKLPEPSEPPRKTARTVLQDELSKELQRQVRAKRTMRSAAIIAYSVMGLIVCVLLMVKFG